MRIQIQQLKLMRIRNPASEKIIRCVAILVAWIPVVEAGSSDGLLTLRPEELGEVLVGVVHLVVELQVGQPQVHRQRYRLQAPEEQLHL